MSFRKIIDEFKQIAPKVDFWSLRLVLESFEILSVREGVVQPPQFNQNRGVHITLIDGDGFAYAATSELNRNGFKRAIEQALAWSKLSAQHGIMKATNIPRPQQSGNYQSQIVQPWQSTNMGEKIEMLQEVNRALKIRLIINSCRRYEPGISSTSYIVRIVCVRLECTRWKYQR